MTSMHTPCDFHEGDVVRDTRSNRTGIITHRPEPGAWICLGDPDNLDDLDRRWHVLYGDLQPITDPETTP